MSTTSASTVVPAQLTSEDKKTIKSMAAAWAGLLATDKTTAANELEKLGKMTYGDQVFQQAMANEVGEPKQGEEESDA